MEITGLCILVAGLQLCVAVNQIQASRMMQELRTLKTRMLRLQGVLERALATLNHESAPIAELDLNDRLLRFIAADQAELAVREYRLAKGVSLEAAFTYVKKLEEVNSDSDDTEQRVNQLLKKLEQRNRFPVN